MKKKTKRYFWLKLHEDFLIGNGGAVDFLMSQKDGANYVVLYLMLCMMTINSNGSLSYGIGEVLIKFDEQKIARDCKYFSIDTVRIAMPLYARLGLIYEDKDGTLCIADFEKIVGSESESAKTVREWREKKALSYEENEDITKLLQCNHNVTQDIRYKIKDIKIKDIDIKKKKEEKEKKLSISSDNSMLSQQNVEPDVDVSKFSYQDVINLYHSICISYPKVNVLSNKRKTAINARTKLKGVTLDTFKTVFERMEASDFLKGANNRNWTATFDWVLCDANFAKVLDGNYSVNSSIKKSNEQPEWVSNGMKKISEGVKEL